MTVQENKTSVEVLKVNVENIKEKLKTFVTKDKFEPIEKIVWTLVVLVLTSFIGAVIKVVIK